MATKVKKTAPRPARAKQNRRERGTSTISSKNQITIPAEVMSRAPFKPGDRVEIKITPDGGVVIEAAGLTPTERIERAAGVFSGLYPPNYLEDLRNGKF